MKFSATLTFILLGFCFFGYSQQEAITTDQRKVVLFENGTWKYADSIPEKNAKFSPIPGLEIPANVAGEAVVKHFAYTLSYNEMHEQASWVAYELTEAETHKTIDRSDKFVPDPAVKTGSATDKDYAKSGFDRGHLAPAADMGWSVKAMAESFYFSNMSPQDPGFNRGIWKKLEEQVRDWAIEYETLYIATGPVLSSGLRQIGPEGVSVPKYYYKVLLRYQDHDKQGIGFVLPNEPSSEPLQRFVVSIDSVEKLTGLNFFPKLPDQLESKLEKTSCLPCWKWPKN